MGERLTDIDFTPEQFRIFRQRLDTNLQALASLLSRPGFGCSSGTLGAELEIYIIDAEGQPLPVNSELLAAAADPLLTLELNRFNLEYNFPPMQLCDRPFFATEQLMCRQLKHLDQLAAGLSGRIVPVGILPTLKFEHFGPSAMTDEPRYHALKRILTESRGSPFRTSIAGEDELLISTDDITFEGANTSFQVHYKVRPDEFTDTYNTAQLITPLLVSVAANSPTAFAQCLWQETRIPLFKKSIDNRKQYLLDDHHWHQPPRVNFGNGWLRQGALELFTESVQLYPVLLPVVSEEDAGAVIDSGGIPQLHELRMHQGTVWLWNRPVYDAHDGGHLRIEFRALPSGPSPVDMVANMALAIGLTEGLKHDINRLITALPFHIASHNFYQAARNGLQANLVWPDPQASQMHESPVGDIIRKLLPAADAGLAAIGIDSEERSYYLGIIEQRVSSGQNGARWQLDRYQQLRRNTDDTRALREMLEQYYRQSCANLPVSQWQ